MEINEDLIRRFFKKECTPAEADFVADYLLDHPELSHAHVNQNEFDNAEAESLNNNNTLAEWEKLQLQIRSRGKRRNTILLAAACFIGMVMSGVFFLSNNSRYKQQANNENTFYNEPEADISRYSNRTDTILQVILPDGSKIRLSPNAEIAFSTTTWKLKRDIELKGEATFYVAKDKQKPFTVYCNDVSVMAVGTVFSVRQHKGADSLRVRLHEGKVLVSKFKRGLNNDTVRIARSSITLKPGEEALYAIGLDKAIVRSFVHTKPYQVVAKQKRTGRQPIQNLAGWVEFSDQPLGDLFTSLEVLYNVEINYNYRDVKGIYFVGRFEPYDSIGGVLAIIARLNGLTVKKVHNGSFIVRK
jgi:transmembrane sensor